MPKNRLSPLIFVSIAVPFIALPFVLGEYQLNTLVLLLIFMVLAVSFRIVALTGEYSLAHVVMMGIGGYTSALLARHFGLPFWVTLPLGGFVAAGFAAITAYPLFRMKGIYFFLGSFAIGEAVRLSWIQWRVPFGGTDGIRFIPAPTASLPGLGTIAFNTVFSYYFLTLGVTAACLFIMYLIDISRVGETFRAIHSQDALCESLGINVLRYKTLAYVTGSFFAGISGVLLAHYMGSVTPYEYGLSMMLYCIVWVIVGGENTFWGPVAGVFTLVLLEEGLRGTLITWMPMVYGFCLIAVVLALPGGLESLPQRITEWRRARRDRRGQSKEIVSG